MSTFDVQVVIAVAKELLNAKVGLIRVNVGPVCHVELLINSEPPLFCLCLDAAVISLRTQIVTIQRMALRLIVDKLHLLNIVFVNLCSDDVIAETTTCR